MPTNPRPKPRLTKSKRYRLFILRARRLRAILLVGICVSLLIPFSGQPSPFKGHSGVSNQPTKEQLKAYTRAHYAGDEIQFECLDALFTMESHWNFKAKHPNSKAYGIPQALPARKMAVSGHDYMTNPYTQIRWGLRYLKSRYNNSGCRALRFHLNHNYW